MKWNAANDLGGPQADGSRYVLVWASYRVVSDLSGAGQLKIPQPLRVLHVK
jgi:hypothetical protein